MRETTTSHNSKSKVDEGGFSISATQQQLSPPPANVVFSNVNVGRKSPQLSPAFTNKSRIINLRLLKLKLPLTQKRRRCVVGSPLALGRYEEPPFDDHQRQLCLAWSWRTAYWLCLAKKQLSPPNGPPRQSSSLLKLLSSSSFTQNNDDVPRSSLSANSEDPSDNNRKYDVDDSSRSSSSLAAKSSSPNNSTHGSVKSSLLKQLPSFTNNPWNNNDDVPQSSLAANSSEDPPDNNRKDDVDDRSSSSEGKPLVARRPRHTSLAAKLSCPNSEGDPINYNVSTSSPGESTLAIITVSPPMLPTSSHQPPILPKTRNTPTPSLNPLPLLSRARSSSALPAGGFARAPPPPPPPGAVEQQVDNRWKLTMDTMLGLMGILAGFAIASIFNIPGGSVNTPDQVAGVGTASLLPYGYGTEVIYSLSGSTIVIILFLLLCFLGGLGGPRFSRIALLLLAEAILCEVASLATHMLITLDYMHGHTPMWLGVVFSFAAIFLFMIFF